MAIVLPPSVPVDGMLKVVWVPTLADPNVPKLTEVGTAVATAIDITCYLTKDGGFKGKFDQKGFVDSRLCATEDWEQLGGISRTLEDIEYVYSPQAALAAVTNAAYEKLVPGSKGYFVVRRAIAYETTLAVGQFVAVWGTTLGGRDEVGDTTNAVFKMVQKLSPYFYAEKVALVA
jgi:hypothetical protein